MERYQPQLGTQRDVIGRRVAALILDAVILGVVGFLAIWIGGLLSDTLGILLSGVYGLAVFAYFIYMEGTYGQTIGKRLMNIMVVNEDGSQIGMRASAIRNILRIVDGFGAYLVGLIVMLVTDDRQRVGDLVADTIVVRAAETVAPAETPSVMESQSQPAR